LTADATIGAQAAGASYLGFNLNGSVAGAHQLELFVLGYFTAGYATLTNSLTANTAGSLLLTGTNATAPSFTFYVLCNSANALGSGPLTLNGAVLKLNGYSYTIANLSSTAQNGTIVNGNASTASTLTVGWDNSSTTYGGVFGDGGAATLGLTKVGGGTLDLTGASTNSGATTVQGGTLQVDGSLGSGNLEVQGGATLGGAGTIGGNVTLDSGAFATNNEGSPLTIGGALVLNNNTLNVSTPSALGAGTYTLITYNTSGSSGSFNPTPVISGAGLAAGSSGSTTTSGGKVSLVVSVVNPPSLTGGSKIGSGQFNLSFSGSSGQPFSVRATNLLTAPISTWPVLFSGSFGVGGPTATNFVDTQATNAQEFYNITLP
jgi:autotransporter-associated beta strand protein